jgi:hypothetical protein
MSKPLDDGLKYGPPVEPDELVSESSIGGDLSSKSDDLAAGLLDTGGESDLEVTTDEYAIVVDKPTKGHFFRVHPTLHCDIHIFKRKGARGEEKYAVYRKMVKHVPEATLSTLFYGVHRDGSFFLWPISATSTDNYSKTGRQIAIKSMKVWSRLLSNTTTGNYSGRFAEKLTEEPLFPANAKTMREILNIAFGDGHIIADISHPVILELNPELSGV